jgi:LmbE family N-acetylglucosaminyl deacetylase
MSLPPRVTILAPHLDDAVLSCWSVLTAATDVRVLNVFAGVPRAGSVGWWDRETGALDSVARMRDRLREDAEALACAGRDAINLDVLELQYRDGGDPTPEELLAAVAGHVDTDVVYGPAGIGGHGDHLLVRSLLGPLEDRGLDVRVYAELPYCARHGWPGWVSGATGDDRADDQWARAIGGLEIDIGARTPRAIRLTPAAQEAKRRALAAYRSQFEALTASSSLHVTDPLVWPFEAFWEPTAGAPVIAAASRS